MSTRERRAQKWVRELLALHGVLTIEWEDSRYGMVRVPRKWHGVIADLSDALVGVSAGARLPRLPKSKPEGAKP